MATISWTPTANGLSRSDDLAITGRCERPATGPSWALPGTRRYADHAVKSLTRSTSAGGEFRKGSNTTQRFQFSVVEVCLIAAFQGAFTKLARIIASWYGFQRRFVGSDGRHKSIYSADVLLGA